MRGMPVCGCRRWLPSTAVEKGGTGEELTKSWQDWVKCFANTQVTGTNCY